MSKSFIFNIAPNEREILDVLNKSKNKWLGCSQKFHDTWKNINPKDTIYVGDKNKSKILFKCIVKKTILDENSPKKLWPKNIRCQSNKFLVNIKNMKTLNTNFHEFLRLHNIKNKNKSGLFTIVDEIKKNKPQEKDTAPLPTDYEEPPKKYNSKVTRFIRDTTLTKELKIIYNNTCQVCNLKIKIDKNTDYSEVHHVRPLKEKGEDNFPNMIVLCPNHHTMFDYNVMGISKDGKFIIDNNNKKLSKLFSNNNYKIAEKNIKYQYWKLR